MVSSMLQKSFAGVALGQKGSEVRLRLRSFLLDLVPTAHCEMFVPNKHSRRAVLDCSPSGRPLEVGPENASLRLKWIREVEHKRAAARSRAYSGSKAPLHWSCEA